MSRSLSLAGTAGLATTAILVLAGWAAGVGTGPAVGAQPVTEAAQVESLAAVDVAVVADLAPALHPDLVHDDVLPTPEHVDSALQLGLRVYVAGDGTAYAVDPTADTPLALSRDLVALGERLAVPGASQVETQSRILAVYDQIDRADATGRTHVLVIPTRYPATGWGARTLYVVATRASSLVLDPFEAVHDDAASAVARAEQAIASNAHPDAYLLVDLTG